MDGQGAGESQDEETRIFLYHGRHVKLMSVPLPNGYVLDDVLGGTPSKVIPMKGRFWKNRS